MDEVECVGTETNLGMCRFQGWGNTDCSHSEDAGVICQDSKWYIKRHSFQQSFHSRPRRNDTCITLIPISCPYITFHIKSHRKCFLKSEITGIHANVLCAASVINTYLLIFQDRLKRQCACAVKGLPIMQVVWKSNITEPGEQSVMIPLTLKTQGSSVRC